MQKIIFFLLALSVAMQASAYRDGPPPSYEEATPSAPTLTDQPVSLHQGHTPEESLDSHYKQLLDFACSHSQVATVLTQEYKSADRILKGDMDCALQPTVLEKLRGENAADDLDTAACFFNEYFSQTQNPRKPLRKALQNILTREICKAGSPYGHIQRPSQEILSQAENTLLGDGNTCSQKQKKTLLRTNSESTFSLYATHINHAYVCQENNQATLIAMYKNLPWLQKRKLKKLLKASFKAQKCALERQYKGFMRMSK